MITFLQLLIVALSIFLILLILIQRGRGGGLAGAFGGAGGQSAIGTRAGDVFTRITFVCILLWFILNAVTGVLMRKEKEVFKASGVTTKKADAKTDGGIGAPDKKQGEVTGNAEKKDGPAEEEPKSGSKAESIKEDDKAESSSAKDEAKKE